MLDGRTVSGAVVGIEPDWTIVAARPVAIPSQDSKADISATKKPAKIAGDTTFRVKISELAYWGQQRETSNPFVVLVDGSQVAGDLIRFGRKQLTVGIDYEVFSQRSIWEPADIPLAMVRGVVFQPPGDLGERDRLQTWMHSPKVRTDRLRLTNGDELSGTALRISLQPQPVELETKDGSRAPAGAATARDPLEIEAENKRVFWFKTSGRETAAPIEFVRAVALNPATAKHPGREQTAVTLAFRDGSRLVARGVDIRDDRVVVTTACGASLTTSRERFIRQLLVIQPLQSDRVDYLSDLDSLAYRHVPFLATSWPKFGKDQSVKGGRLRSANASHDKGISMHSASRLAYDLKRPYARFQAELAIDDSVGDSGSVVFRVYIDKGDGKFAAAYASPIVRGGQLPLSISVDIRGAKRLALIVDFSDRGDSGDHANWLNARLVLDR